MKMNRTTLACISLLVTLFTGVAVSPVYSQFAEPGPDGQNASGWQEESYTGQYPGDAQQGASPYQYQGQAQFQQNQQAGEYYGAQQPSYGAQQPSYGAQQPSYGAQQPNYGAQQPNYGAQQPSYGAQQPSYGAQQPNYGGQQPDYGAQQPNYGAQQPDYGAMPGQESPQVDYNYQQSPVAGEAQTGDGKLGFIGKALGSLAPAAAMIGGAYLLNRGNNSSPFGYPAGDQYGYGQGYGNPYQNNYGNSYGYGSPYGNSQYSPYGYNQYPGGSYPYPGTNSPFSSPSSLLSSPFGLW